MQWRHTNDIKRIREQMKLEYSIETALRHLLEKEEYRRRSLRKIKQHIRGLKTDDELRMALLRAGAVAIRGEGEDEEWGLLSRNFDDVR